MKNTLIIATLKKTKRELEAKMKKQKNNCLLYIRKKKGHLDFYSRNRETKEETYLPKSNMDAIKALAQSMYESELAECAAQEIRNLDLCIRILEKSPDVELLFSKLSDEMKSLVIPNAPDDEYARKWQNTIYECFLDPPNEDYETDRGEYVRSKTERHIANRLHAMGINYHYEKPIEIEPGEFLHPDFTILNKKTRKVYLWEHFGRMDNDEYCRKCIMKIESYAKAGYLLNDNLIVTFESSKKSLSSFMVNRIIKRFFL